MRVFITGGAGFIGSHLARFFLDKGWEVTAYDNLSLGKTELLAPAMKNPRFKIHTR